MLKIPPKCKRRALKVYLISSSVQAESMIEYGFYIIQRAFAHFASFLKMLHRRDKYFEMGEIFRLCSPKGTRTVHSRFVPGEPQINSPLITTVTLAFNSVSATQVCLLLSLKCRV